MFLNDSNRAKVLALLLVFGLNNDCGAMESISSMDTRYSSKIDRSHGSGQNGESYGDVWHDLFECVCKERGHGILPLNIWNKIPKISMMETDYSATNHRSQLKSLLMAQQNTNNTYELISSGRTSKVTSISAFMKMFNSMFQEETKKMRQKSPQELLDKYWIPEFGARNFYGYEQPEQNFRYLTKDECNIPEEISSWDPENKIFNCNPSSKAYKCVLAAYALPDRDSWRVGLIAWECNYASDLSCAIENFQYVVQNKNIDKIVFEPGMPLRYYSGKEIKNLDVQNTNGYKTSSLFTNVIQKSDRAEYFLDGRNKLYLVNLGILLISQVLERFINQAVDLSGLSDQMFDRIEITKCGYGPKFEVFKDGKEIEHSSQLYKTVCQKLANIYILNRIYNGNYQMWLWSKI